MNVGLLTELQAAKDVGEVMTVITRHSEPFGYVHTWRFSRDRKSQRMTVWISLAQQQHHRALAESLGGTINDGEVCFIIPINDSFEACGVTTLRDQGQPMASEGAQRKSS